MSNVFHFCLLMPGLVFSLCTLNVVTDSMLTKAVSASDTGEGSVRSRALGGAACPVPGHPPAGPPGGLAGGFLRPSCRVWGLVCLTPPGHCSLV